MENFNCSLKTVRPVAEWVEDKSAEGCPPCLIAPLASYYLGALEEGGQEKLAEELKTLFAEGNVLTISQKLDTIKSDVGDQLKQQLRNLDCFAQTFKPDDAAEKQHDAPNDEKGV